MDSKSIEPTLDATDCHCKCVRSRELVFLTRILRDLSPPSSKCHRHSILMIRSYYLLRLVGATAFNAAKRCYVVGSVPPDAKFACLHTRAAQLRDICPDCHRIDVAASSGFQ